MPAPDCSRKARRQISLNDRVIAENGLPIAPHYFCEEATFVDQLADVVNHNAREHGIVICSLCFYERDPLGTTVPHFDSMASPLRKRKEEGILKYPLEGKRG